MDKLSEEISIEKEYIEKTLKLLDEALSRSEKSAIELSAIGIEAFDIFLFTLMGYY